MSVEKSKDNQIKVEMQEYFRDLFGETGLATIGKSPVELVSMLDTITREEVFKNAEASARKDGPKPE